MQEDTGIPPSDAESPVVAASATAEATTSGLSAQGFDLFFAEQSLGLVKLAYLLLDDRAAAEDAAQDAMTEIYRRWSGFSSYGAALVYARTSVVNRSRSSLRRRVVALRHAPRLVTPEIGLEPDLVQRKWLLDAIRELPRRQREVVVMRYWLDLSEADIAAALGVSAGTVKSTASRALARLNDITSIHQGEQP